MIGAGIEPDNGVGLDVLDHQLLFAIDAFLGLVDVEQQLAGGNTRVDTGHRIEHQAAGFHDDVLGLDRSVAGHGEFLRHPGATEGDMEEIVARLEFELSRAAFGGGEQRQFAFGIGSRMEDAPAQSVFQGLAGLGQGRLHPHGPADGGGIAGLGRRRIFGQSRQGDFRIGSLGKGVLRACQG